MLRKSTVYITVIIIIEFMEANYPQSAKKNPTISRRSFIFSEHGLFRNACEDETVK